MGERIDDSFSEILDIDGDPFTMQLEGIVTYDQYIGHPSRRDNPYSHTILLDNDSRELWIKTVENINGNKSIRIADLSLDGPRKLTQGNYKLIVQLSKIMYFKGTVRSLTLNIIDVKSSPRTYSVKFEGDSIHSPPTLISFD